MALGHEAPLIGRAAGIVGGLNTHDVDDCSALVRGISSEIGAGQFRDNELREARKQLERLGGILAATLSNSACPLSAFASTNALKTSRTVAVALLGVPFCLPPVSPACHLIRSTLEEPQDAPPWQWVELLQTRHRRLRAKRSLSLVILQSCCGASAGRCRPEAVIPCAAPICRKPTLC